MSETEVKGGMMGGQDRGQGTQTWDFKVTSFCVGVGVGVGVGRLPLPKDPLFASRKEKGQWSDSEDGTRESTVLLPGKGNQKEKQSVTRRQLTEQAEKSSWKGDIQAVFLSGCLSSPFFARCEVKKSVMRVWTISLINYLSPNMLKVI